MEVESKEAGKEAFLEWRAHPVTQGVMEALRCQVESAKAQWADGHFLRDRDAEVGTLGRIAAYQSVIEIDFEEVYEVPNNG